MIIRTFLLQEILIIMYTNLLTSHKEQVFLSMGRYKIREVDCAALHVGSQSLIIETQPCVNEQTCTYK